MITTYLFFQEDNGGTAMKVIGDDFGDEQPAVGLKNRKKLYFDLSKAYNKLEGVLKDFVKIKNELDAIEFESIYNMGVDALEALQKAVEDNVEPLMERVKDYAVTPDIPGELEKVASELIKTAGGGSGINFKTNGNTKLMASGTLSKQGHTVKVETEKADSFDADGYQDGMHNVKMDLLDLGNIAKDNVSNFLLSFKLDENDMRDIIDASDKDFDDDEIEILVKNCKTIGDMLDYIGKVKFDLTLTIESYKGQRFGGYTRGTLTKGDVIFDDAGNTELELDINGTAVGDRYADVTGIIPIYVAGNEFEYFYKSVFYDTHENITSNLKQYIKDNLEEYNEKNSDDEEYMKMNDDERVEHIIENDKGGLYESEASVYWDMLKDEYGA